MEDGEDGEDCMTEGIKQGNIYLIKIIFKFKECLPAFMKKVAGLPADKRVEIVEKIKS